MSSDPFRGHGVLLLLVDGPADVPAAREAAVLAARAGTRVLAAAVLPTGGRSVVDSQTLLRRRRAEAQAIGGRVRPALEAHDVPLTVVPLLAPVGVNWSRRSLRRSLRLLAARSGASSIIVPASPVLGVPPTTVASWAPHAVVAGAWASRQREPH